MSGSGGGFQLCVKLKISVQTENLLVTDDLASLWLGSSESPKYQWNEEKATK
jgi:hypothetical protein